MEHTGEEGVGSGREGRREEGEVEEETSNNNVTGHVERFNDFMVKDT